MKPHVLLLALTILLNIMPAHAATYTVGPDGTDSFDCSQKQQTLHAGIACLQRGDTLLIEDGIYDDQSTQAIEGLGLWGWFLVLVAAGYHVWYWQKGRSPGRAPMLCLYSLMVVLLMVSTPHAATFTVGPDGNDAAPCDQMGRTIQGGLACLRSGDTLEVDAGVYEESIGILHDGSHVSIPLGFPDQPTIIRSTQRHGAILRSPTPIVLMYERPTEMYIAIEGFICDTASNTAPCIQVGNGSYARFTDMQVHGKVARTYGSAHLEFLDMQGIQVIEGLGLLGRLLVAFGLLGLLAAGYRIWYWRQGRPAGGLYGKFTLGGIT